MRPSYGPALPGRQLTRRMTAMRRSFAIIVVLLLCGGMLVPTAAAGIAALDPHFCCVRKPLHERTIHHHDAHCGHSSEIASAPELGFSAPNDCGHCGPSLAFSIGGKAKP